MTSTEITIEPISPKPFEKNKNIVVLNVPQRERFPPPKVHETGPSPFGCNGSNRTFRSTCVGRSLCVAADRGRHLNARKRHHRSEEERRSALRLEPGTQDWLARPRHAAGPGQEDALGLKKPARRRRLTKKKKPRRVHRPRRGFSFNRLSHWEHDRGYRGTANSALSDLTRPNQAPRLAVRSG